MKMLFRHLKITPQSIAGWAGLGLAVISFTGSTAFAQAPTQPSAEPSPEPVSIAALFGDEPDPLSPAKQTPESPQADARQSDYRLNNALDALSDINAGDRIPSQVSETRYESIFADRKTTYDEGRFLMPPIEALTVSMDSIGEGDQKGSVPPGYLKGVTPPVTALPESGLDRGLPWQWNTSYWAASNTFSHPLYFEDRMLERHGHYCHPCLQPFLSGGRFAGQFVMLPYLCAIDPACECDYTLGYYRAGSCAPALKQRPPYQRKAVVAEAATLATGLTILP
ncbi:hypothetical protein NHH03_09445 [Stieleria sp. TO1_6]|uniref:hypothetical protein n=1 Tax=Stieleria tagensis TaxID=2956795 RepID=UPI00209A8FCD|nr:hypothetical protein [Stieleria tagensis]MCO8121959.1 hypothetical protein [Stieleria tagensis]